ncbi:MAG: hypothetical protein ACSHWQ_06030 [Spongiibacteraceae bacterium]
MSETDDKKMHQQRMLRRKKIVDAKNHAFRAGIKARKGVEW